MDMSHVIVCGIVLATVFKSLWFRRTSSNATDNWLLYSKGSLQPVSSWRAALGIYSGIVGGFLVLGVPQLGYSAGLTGYILGLAYPVGAILLLMCFSPEKAGRLLNGGLFGIDNLLTETYGKWTAKSYLLVSLLLYVAFLATQFLSVAAFLETFVAAKDVTTVVILSCVLTVAYTVARGLHGVLANDVWQTIFEGGLCIVIPGLVLASVLGDATARFSPLESGIGGERGALFPFTFAATIAISFLARADIWQRLQLVDPPYRHRTLLIVVVLVSCYYFGMTTAGLLLRQNPETFPFASAASRDGVLIPKTLEALSPSPLFTSLCVSGVVIAILSSLDTFLNLVGLIGNRLLGGDATIDFAIGNARWATVTAALLSTILAIYTPDIVDIVSGSFGIMGVIAPIIYQGVNSQTKLPDWLGTIAILGSVLLVVFLFLFVTDRNYAVFGAVVIASVVLIVTNITVSRQARLRTDK